MTQQSISVTKKTRVGWEILDRIMERDTDKGGVFMEITGIQGSGKTSLMLLLAEKILNKHPEEKVFWRDSIGSPLQFTKIDRWDILVREDCKIKFVNVETKRKVRLPITTFSNFDELMNVSREGRLSAVFLPSDDNWIDLIKYIRQTPKWQTVFLDEYEDVCPQRCSGERWHKNEWMASNIKQVRKGLVNVIADTQSIMDVDFRVRSKIMIYGYLYGARVDRLSPVMQHAVNSMEIGKCWLDWGHSIYGQIKFPPYTPKQPIIVAEYVD